MDCGADTKPFDTEAPGGANRYLRAAVTENQINSLDP